MSFLLLSTAIVQCCKASRTCLTSSLLTLANSTHPTPTGALSFTHTMHNMVGSLPLPALPTAGGSGQLRGRLLKAGESAKAFAPSAPARHQPQVLPASSPSPSKKSSKGGAGSSPLALFTKGVTSLVALSALPDGSAYAATVPVWSEAEATTTTTTAPVSAMAAAPSSSVAAGSSSPSSTSSSSNSGGGSSTTSAQAAASIAVQSPSTSSVASEDTTQSDSSSSGSEASRTSFVMVAGSSVLPHPDKVAKGGEDWFFIANSGRAVGIADGVGGWAEIGVDSGAYSRQLMEHSKHIADEDSTSSQPLSAQSILERAYNQVTVRGSCTACVVVLNGPQLLASNLGDSGFLVLRNNKVHFYSPQQQHDFNFPYQIGSPDSQSDQPSAADRYELQVQAGDVIVLGTDGLWDNCFHEEITSVLKYCGEVKMTPDKTAQVLAHYARHRASDNKFASPFAYAAYQAGYAYMGGKMDDITVVVAIVQPASKL